ncbi:hypothetical protein RHMOL_Rhmol03G0008900 [Rhododendron molle]|uniref:Uncharacterized protein n=1 Tax=Rhododendron molle TaxID=49168 RepID=A0ACC0PBL1_RHOML|nr:hypothetical protein RHMOL_Rhmol03G0008900 [Rhododendron molle]
MDETLPCQVWRLTEPTGTFSVWLILHVPYARITSTSATKFRVLFLVFTHFTTLADARQQRFSNGCPVCRGRALDVKDVTISDLVQCLVDSPCPICKDNFDFGDKISNIVPCFHSFHHSCIADARQQGFSNGCPVCRGRALDVTIPDLVQYLVDSPCPICKDNFDFGDKISSLVPCFHSFHHSCIVDARQQGFKSRTFCIHLNSSELTSILQFSSCPQECAQGLLYSANTIPCYNLVMDYVHVDDTSGTDDDLPPSHHNRLARGGRVAGNGRSFGGSVPFNRMHIDMDSEIHQLEKEAYSSVLRAFKAQSDALTWEKEGLITELRKELRVSDDEHRELLTRVNSDDIIRRIREWRQSGGHNGSMLSTPQAVHDLLPSPTTARKKQKTSQSGALSAGVPLRPLHSQGDAASMQPSPAAAKRGHPFGSGGKRHKPGQPFTGLSSVNSMQYPNRTSSGAIVTNETAEAAINDPLIGRKVMTRWPEDDNFYEAVITNYNPIEISPDDIRWVGDDPGIPHRGVNNSLSLGVTPRAGRGRGAAKELPRLQNGLGRVSDEIEILHTETLLKEEHEQALIDVIEKLADASDSESDGEPQISHGQSMNGGWRSMHYTEIQS